MVDAQTISVVVASFGVLIAAFYYIVTLKNNNKTRQAQLFMGIYQAQYSRDMLKAEVNGTFNIDLKDVNDYNAIVRDPEKYEAFNMWAGYLKGIGVLVREDLVDIRLVSQLMSGQINWWWGKYGQGVLQCRKDLSWPRYCIDIEHLYDRVNEYARVHPELQIAHPRREGTTLSAPST